VLPQEIRKKLPLILFGLGALFATLNYSQIYLGFTTMSANWITAGGSVSPLPIFYMVPFAFSTYLTFGIALISGILFFWKKDLKFDLLLVSSAQVGVVIGAITIIVGMIWAKPEWGEFWDWNPRETITLIMWLIYVAVLIFRDMLEEENPEKKATISAIFGIIAFVSVPFTYVIVGNLHPNPETASYGTGAGIWIPINFLFIGVFSLILVYQTYRINLIDFTLKSMRKAKMEES
jgi:heme exporter protein C